MNFYKSLGMKSISKGFEVHMGIRKEAPSRPMGKFRLHPLIYTTPLENLLQDVEGGSQRANCELKYDI